MNPWVVGWIASDGHNNGSSWSISQNIEDVDPLMLIREIYPDVGVRVDENSRNRYGDKPMVIIWRNSREDCIELSRQGIPSGDKTETLDFPDSLSEEDMWLYLRGVYEGDGSISMESNTYPRIGITTSKLWCEKCERWLIERDIRAYTVKDGGAYFLLNDS